MTTPRRRQSNMRVHSQPESVDSTIPQPAACPTVNKHGITVLWQPEEMTTIKADVILTHGRGGAPAEHMGI